jgi:hypothetical protein
MHITWTLNIMRLPFCIIESTHTTIQSLVLGPIQKACFLNLLTQSLKMKPNIPAVISSSSKIARKIAYWKLKRASLILHSCLL